MTYDPVHAIVNRLNDLGKTTKKSAKGFKAQCPAHDDSTASMELDYGDKGDALICCQAGCSLDSIMAALDMPISALFEEQAQPPAQVSQPIVPGAEAVYYYCDETGRVLFRVEKRLEANGHKTFRQARPDPANPAGAWINNLGNTRRVPYRMEAVVAAAKEGDTVFIVEGEKDVLALEMQGAVASCNPGGAGKFKREFAEHFAGANCILIPDNDDPGHEHMKQVAEHLAPVARSVTMLDLAGYPWTDKKLKMPPKADVSDWLAADDSHTLDLLLEWAEAVKPLSENKPMIFSAEELMRQKFEDVQMAVPGFLAEGLNILAGAPKIGKSWIVLSLALSIATGTPALGSIEVVEGDVLYLALEDTPRRLQRRMFVMIGETEGPERLEFACTWPKLNAGGLDRLEDWLKEHDGARLVIIDTLAKVKGGGNENANGSMYNDDYAFIASIKALADQYAVCIVLIHHQRKASSEDALNTVAGSTGLTGAADAILVLTRARGSDAGYLYVTGRDVEESKAMLEFEPQTGQWLYLGDADDVQEQNDQTKVIALLKEAHDAQQGPMTPSEVAQALDMKDGTAKWLLSKMVQEGKIGKLKRGQYVWKDPSDGAPMVGNLPPGVTAHVSTQPPMPGLPGPTRVAGLVAVDDDEGEELSDEDVALLLEGDGFEAEG